MSKVTFTVHYCPHCDRNLPDADFSTFRDHVLEDHLDDPVLVGAVSQNSRWQVKPREGNS